MNNFRIGHGYDAHRLVSSIPLIICGVHIESPVGSHGHSDGDVGYHSICDAILGALALGDLGFHFPSSNENWRNTDSKFFFEQILRLMDEKKYTINNIDCTIILESPYINKYIDDMRNNIASICNVDVSCISVKATTTDKIGFIGRGEGISSLSVVLLQKDNHER